MQSKNGGGKDDYYEEDFEQDFGNQQDLTSDYRSANANA